MKRFVGPLLSGVEERQKYQEGLLIPKERMARAKSGEIYNKFLEGFHLHGESGRTPPPCYTSNKLELQKRLGIL